jgi:hypothetical protein
MDWTNIDWREMFIPTYSVVEVFLRGTITYLSLFVILRFFVEAADGCGRYC